MKITSEGYSVSSCRAVLTATCLIVVLSAGVAIAAEPASASQQDKYVDGVAKFLIDRADDNCRYVFQQKIKDNRAMKLYMPTVYEYLERYDLYVLLRLSSDTWENALEKDIKGVMGRFEDMIEKKVIKKTALRLMEEYEEKVGDFEFEVEGKTCTLEKPEKNDPSCKDMYTTIKKEREEALAYFAQKTEEELTRVGIDRKRLEESLKLGDIAEVMADIFAGVEETNRRIEDIVKTEKYEIKNKKDVLKRTGKLLRKVRSVKKAVELIVEYEKTGEDDVFGKTDKALRVIELMYEHYDEKLFTRDKDYEIHQDYFDRFKTYVMMFVQIAEAKGADDVQAILEAYTLPPVSFDVKRAEGWHLTVSSYLGLAGGIENVDEAFSSDYDYFVSLFAPVGIEVSRGKCRWLFNWRGAPKDSCGLFFSVFDFGAAVSAQVYDEEHDFELRDVLAPGIFYVVGIKEFPLAAGIGYQNTKALADDTRNAHHFLIFLALDMPLFTIY